MKTILTIILFGLLTIGPASASTITFDDLSTEIGGSVVPNGYAGVNKGLNWVNMYVLNAEFVSVQNLGPSGYNNAVVSRPNVAFMGDDLRPVVVSGPAFKFNS